MSPMSARRGVLYICLAAAAWGTGGAAGKLLFAHSGLDAIGVSLWRYLLGAAFLFLTARALSLRESRPASVRTGRARHILVVGVGMAIYQTAYFAAIAESGVAIATVVTMGASTLFVVIGGRFTLGETLGGPGAVAMIAALAGLVMLTAEQTGTGTLLGICLALLSAAGYAGVTLYGRRHHGDPAATTMGGFAIGALCLAPFAATALPALTFETIALLLYLGAIPTALAYTLFFKALTAVKASTAAILSLGEAVGAAALGMLLLNEPLTPLAAVGGAVLLAAVVVLTVQGQR